MPRTPLQALVFVVALWATLALLSPMVDAAETNGADPRLVSVEATLHEAINAVRAQHGLIALQRDGAIDAVARAHSRDMATRQFFAHETPEGLTPPDRLAQGGVTYITLAGENVGLTNRNDPNGEIVQSWLASPVHRQNLLAPMFNRTGIGIAQAPNGTLYYTQLYVTVPR